MRSDPSSSATSTSPPASSPLSIEALNLRRLIYLRVIAIVCELIVILVAGRAFDMALPMKALLGLIVLQAGVNLVAVHQIRRPGWPVSQRLFFVHIVIDTLIFAGLMYFTGGSSNPLVSLFLLPLFTVAATLPQGYVWLMSGLTIVSYTLLMFVSRPMPHVMHGHETDFSFHVQGMWFGFMLSVALVMFFVVRMSNSLRERDERLARAREQALRDQNLVAMGTLATGAAHELGTPLSTMAVIANEFVHERPDDPYIVEKAGLMRSQIERCKGILSEMTAGVRQARFEGGRAVAADAYVDDMIQSFESSRPGVVCRLACVGPGPAPRILADRTLSQALLNILNNAADASPEAIDVRLDWSGAALELSVLDQGSGMAPEMLEAAGTPFMTTKKDGQGLGLYLAFSVVERLGGRIRLGNHEKGGLVVRITIPLGTLLVEGR